MPLRELLWSIIPSARLGFAVGGQHCCCCCCSCSRNVVPSSNLLCARRVVGCLQTPRGAGREQDDISRNRGGKGKFTIGVGPPRGTKAGGPAWLKDSCPRPGASSTRAKGKRRSSDADLPPGRNVPIDESLKGESSNLSSAPTAVHLPSDVCLITPIRPSLPSMPLDACTRVPAIRRRFSFENSCYHQPRWLILCSSWS